MRATPSIRRSGAAAVLAALAACAAPEKPPPSPGEEATEVDRLRADLLSPDPEVALRAAKALGPWSLSLDEIHRQLEILVRRPEEVLSPPGEKACFRCDGAHSLGSPEVIPLLEALVARGGIPAEEHSLDDLHRRTLQDHIPDLARLLDPSDGVLYRKILWMLRLLADNTDRHRETVAGALLYARAAWVAETDGTPLPRLSDFRFPGDGPATSSAFLTRYHGLLRGKDPEDLRIAEEFPAAWWERWEREDAGGAGPPAGPEALTAAEARARTAELAARPAPVYADEWEGVRVLLPLIEVVAPDALDDLLRRWSESALDPDSREEIERLRALRAHPDGFGEGPGPEEVLGSLERGEDPGGEIARLGLLGDRGRPILEKVRGERHRGLYWPATAGLAITGDRAARTEFLAFLREDRIAAYDAGFDEVGFTLNGDPEAVEHWLSRVGSNCCLWSHAWQALRTWYPTMPAENTVGDPEGRERRAREWWERWKGRLRWSRLAGGLVPAAD